MITIVRSVDQVAAMNPKLATSEASDRQGPAPYLITNGVKMKPIWKC